MGGSPLALARGWERNEDTAVNPLFYRAHFSAAEYRRWLHANAVRYVALPRTELDYSAKQERRVIESHPGFLHLVWSSRDWQVFAVKDPTRSAAGRVASSRSPRRKSRSRCPRWRVR